MYTVCMYVNTHTHTHTLFRESSMQNGSENTASFFVCHRCSPGFKHSGPGSRCYAGYGTSTLEKLCGNTLCMREMKCRNAMLLSCCLNLLDKATGPELNSEGWEQVSTLSDGSSIPIDGHCPWGGAQGIAPLDQNAARPRIL